MISHVLDHGLIKTLQLIYSLNIFNIVANWLNSALELLFKIVFSKMTKSRWLMYTFGLLRIEKNYFPKDIDFKLLSLTGKTNVLIQFVLFCDNY